MKYIGSELHMFAKATNWKSYWSKSVRKHVIGQVLDVGAGIGSNLSYLATSSIDKWNFLEPDPELCAQIMDNGLAKDNGFEFEVINGTLQDLKVTARYDTIIYIDVLEHIEDDKGELLRATKHLNVGGCTIVVAPSHQFLFSDFDTSVGHFRRYNKSQLRKLLPDNVEIVQLRYLDSVGTLLSIANKLFLKSKSPTQNQIAFWDKVVVPISMFIDRILGFNLGKTVVMVFRKLNNEI